MKIDMSLNNATLYAGCDIEEVGGERNLKTPMSEAVSIVGANIDAMLAMETDRREVTLIGPMAIWAYLMVFHAVVPCFGLVYYDDGRTGVVRWQSPPKRAMRREIGLLDGVLESAILCRSSNGFIGISMPGDDSPHFGPFTVDSSGHLVRGR